MERSSQVAEENKEMEEQNLTLILETYKNEIEVLKKTVASMNVEIQTLKKKKEKGSNEPLMAKKKTRTVTSEDKCGLCEKFKILDIQPKDSIHHLSLRGNVEPESCGHLREMNVKQMAQLYKNFKMCRVCGYTPISESHQEDKCKFTNRVPRAKCRVKSCSFRFFLCDEHITQNESQVQHRREYYKKSNFPFTFAPEESKSSKKEEVRRKSNTSTQTEEEPDSWISEVESEDFLEGVESDDSIQIINENPQPEAEKKVQITNKDPQPEADDKIQITNENPQPEAEKKVQITNKHPQPEAEEKVQITNKYPQPEAEEKIQITNEDPQPEDSL